VYEVSRLFSVTVQRFLYFGDTPTVFDWLELSQRSRRLRPITLIYVPVFLFMERMQTEGSNVMDNIPLCSEILSSNVFPKHNHPA